MAKKNHSCGIYFDLPAIFLDLNNRFFERSIEASISWGQRRKPSGYKKASIRLGSYHPRDKAIIISPCLDQAIVPTICVERIMFHEMLHQRFPIKKSASGKCRIHYREFYEFEKTYPYLKEADAWIKANLERLLKY